MYYLSQVHEDLLDIKEKLMSNGQVDVSVLQNAIEKTESSIKVSMSAFQLRTLKF